MPNVIVSDSFDGEIEVDCLIIGGGAACGVSGPDVSGYLSGNGLLTALALGHLAGGDGTH